MGIQFRLADQKVDSSDEKSCILLSRDRFCSPDFGVKSEFGEEDVEEQNQQDELKVCPLRPTVSCVLRASPAVYVTLSIPRRSLRSVNPAVNL